MFNVSNIDFFENIMLPKYYFQKSYFSETIYISIYSFNFLGPHLLGPPYQRSRSDKQQRFLQTEECPLLSFRPPPDEAEDVNETKCGDGEHVVGEDPSAADRHEEMMAIPLTTLLLLYFIPRSYRHHTLPFSATLYPLPRDASAM